MIPEPDLVSDLILDLQGSSRPVVLALCGMPGSGKTTWSRSLAAQGWVRLCIDEIIAERVGVSGADFPEQDFPRHRRAAIEQLEAELVEHLHARRSVVAELGLWRRRNRERGRSLVEAAGGVWQVVYFRADLDVLQGRLAARAAHGGPNALAVREEHLQRVYAQFEAPYGEGEIIIDQR